MLGVFCDLKHFTAELLTFCFTVDDLCWAVFDTLCNSFTVCIIVCYFYCLYFFSAVWIIPPVVKVDPVVGAFISEPVRTFVEISCGSVYNDVILYTFDALQLFKVNYPQLFIACHFSVGKNGLIMLRDNKLWVWNFNICMLRMCFQQNVRNNWSYQAYNKAVSNAVIRSVKNTAVNYIGYIDVAVVEHEKYQYYYKKRKNNA